MSFPETPSEKPLSFPLNWYLKIDNLADLRVREQQVNKEDIWKIYYTIHFHRFLYSLAILKCSTRHWIFSAYNERCSPRLQERVYR